MTTKDRREFVGLRLLPESVADARRIAAEEGSDLSTVLRRWMGLGRAAERVHWKPPSDGRPPATPAPRPHPPTQGRIRAGRPAPTPAHGPAQIDADLHAKPQKGHRKP